MKNKKLVYLLLFLAVVVWGMIFYRIFNYVNENDVPEQNISRKEIENSTAKTFEDTFSLVLNYRDPFLGNNVLKDSNDGSKKNNEPVKKKENNEPKNKSAKWPVLSYGGIVKNEGTKNLVVIMSINGKNHLMKPGEIINDCELLKVFSDSAMVRFNDETKTVRYKSYK